MKLFTSTLKRGSAFLGLLALDGALLSLAMLSAFFMRFPLNPPAAAFRQIPHMPSYWLAFGLAFYLVLAQLAALGLYRTDRLRNWREELEGIVKAVTMATLLLLAVSFFYREINYSRQMVFLAWPLAIGSLTAGRLLCRAVGIYFRRRGISSRNVLLVGRGPMLPIILEKMILNPGLGLQARGILSESKVPESKYSDLPDLGGFANLEEVIRNQEIAVCFLIQEKLPQEKILEFIEICERHHVELLLVPQVYDLLIGYAGLRDFQGMPMLELREEPIAWGSLGLKRAVDFGLGGLFLLLTLPLQLALALAIRLDSKGSALFRQERVGYRGKAFQMWKFRSMVANAEDQLRGMIDFADMSEPVFKFKEDPRITRLGKWLRKTSLDELPQLWNVVLGQMSLVGPRPEEVEMVKRYNVWQRRRLKVKPGLTGLQQIKCRGSDSLAERVRYDIYYIRRLSLLLDLEIMVRTIWVVLSQKGAH